MQRTVLPLFFLILLTQCSPAEDDHSLFEQQDPGITNVDFENNLEPTEDFNMYIFRNFYNGGGVAVGDVNGDGLPDIFLTGNMTSNRLYINRGKFRFEDVTEQAGLDSHGYWYTGASMADVNGDGLLDIYVTLSGRPEGEDRHNRLYINNGLEPNGANEAVPVFTESSKDYQLFDDGLSTHGVFFDYNGDDRLDLYLISNSFHEVGSYENVTGSDRENPDPNGASKLYRNDGDRFTDVTEEAGIYSSVLGFGMSASVGDLNRDGYPDLYVANDFFERDYLYINRGDGTFEESLEDRIRSLSFSSMGSDIADINNDGWPEIFVTDMLPAVEERLKSKMTIESWQEYQNNVTRGFHHKFTRNTLQWNQGGGYFSEVGRYSNVYATDWSWATLIADFDNSGNNDIFVANGIYKDLLDQDYIETVSNPRAMQQMVQSGEENVILNLMDQMSSNPISNTAFRNEGDFIFTDQTENWGLDHSGFSTGAAWADFDNDGDLDLVTNDVNGPAKIYKNRSGKLTPDRNWLRVRLNGETPNTYGIGATLHAWAGDKYWYQEHYLQRGFQSSVEPGLHIGVGGISALDSLKIVWPDGSVSREINISLPAELELDQSDAVQVETVDTYNASFNDHSSIVESAQPKETFSEVIVEELSGWKHQKFEYSDFNREKLLAHMRSTEGPALCTGDVNGDQLTDIYIGGARGQAGALWVQQHTGSFILDQPDIFQQDAQSEDVDCVFFDATNDNTDDLYVVSGGNSFSSGSSALSDRFYRNDGKGNFQKSNQILPTTRGFEPGSVVVPYDFSGDGYQDLFVGIRLKPFAIGIPVNGYLLEGDGTGRFTDVTEEFAPSLLEMGMITDAIWADVTGDHLSELIIAGEWMPIRIYEIVDGKLNEITEELGLAEMSGWWNTIEAGDINGDGRIDLVAGNHGLNSIFKASSESPVKMFVGDLSQNGMIDQLIATEENGEYYPTALQPELIETIPSMGNKFPNHASYAGKTIHEIFSQQQLDTALELSATTLESVIFWNTESGFEMEALPHRAQLSPVYGVEIVNLNNDATTEILLGGNMYNVKPQFGPYDASNGDVLEWRNQSLQAVSSIMTGFNVSGEIRKIEMIDILGERMMLIARYNDTPVILRVNE